MRFLNVLFIWGFPTKILWTVLIGSRDSVVNTVTRDWDEWSGVRISAGARDFSLHQNAHRASYSMGTGVPSLE
jgi:hypothetical protein